MVAYHAYQIWKLENQNDDLYDLIIGLHLGDIKITEIVDDDD